jgi:hypothetical protein
MARLSHPARAADLSVNGRLARSEAIMADMRLVLEEVKSRVVGVGENSPKPAQRLIKAIAGTGQAGPEPSVRTPRHGERVGRDW